MCSECTESRFYRAPSNIKGALCYSCGEPIHTGEIIADVDAENVIHERCIEFEIDPDEG